MTDWEIVQEVDVERFWQFSYPPEQSYYGAGLYWQRVLVRYARRIERAKWQPIHRGKAQFTTAYIDDMPPPNPVGFTDLG